MHRLTSALGSILFVYTALSGQTVWAHGDERLGLEPVSETAFPAGNVGYDFQLLDLKQKTILSDTDFDTVHDQKVHVFVYDPALKSLQHLHAEYVGGVWHTDVKLTQDGNYWIWAEGQLTLDKTEGYGKNRLMITGGGPEDTSLPEVSEKRIGNDGTSQVELADDPIVKEQEVMLMLNFSRTDCSMPDVTPYLGEMGHAIVVSDDGDFLAHDHVMMDPKGNLMLHAEFPEEGNYRVWIQYMDGGALKTVSLALPVSGTQGKPASKQQALH